MKKIIFIILIFTVNIFSQEVQFDSTVSAGIKQIYDIKFSEAEKTFKGLIADFPDKPQGKFFLAMIDWWRILLNPDNESYDDIFFQKLEDVIYQCDQILAKDENNEDALFFKGGAIGFRGRLRAFRESWLKAADDGRLALPIVEKAYKINPKNIDVKLGFGIYDYFAAVIPEEYPLIKPLMIFFPPGNKQRGINELEDVAINGKYAKYEARYFLMTLFYNYENNPFQADVWARMLVKDFPDNPVFERWYGRIAAKSGDYASSAKIFFDVWNKAQKNSEGYNNANAEREAAYYIAYHYKDLSKLDSAKYYFNQCIEYSKKIDPKDGSGFMVNSYLYIGMINDELGLRNEAIDDYKKILELKDYNNSHNLAKEYLKQPFLKNKK